MTRLRRSVIVGSWSMTTIILGLTLTIDEVILAVCERVM